MKIEVGLIKLEDIKVEEIPDPISSDSSESEWEDAREDANNILSRIDQFLESIRHSEKTVNSHKEAAKDTQKITPNKTEHRFEPGYCHIRVRMNSWSTISEEKRKLENFARQYGSWQHLWVTKHSSSRMIGYINYNHPFAAERCRKDKRKTYEILNKIK